MTISCVSAVAVLSITPVERKRSVKMREKTFENEMERWLGGKEGRILRRLWLQLEKCGGDEILFERSTNVMLKRRPCNRAI